MPYGEVIPDTSKPETYILRATDKVCAGVVTPKRDIFVDGGWWYYIRDYQTKDRKGKDDGKTACHISTRYSFVIDSLPHDVPALVREARKAGARQYYGEHKVGAFAVTISHASEDRLAHRWLSQKQAKKIWTALDGLLAVSEDRCST